MKKVILGVTITFVVMLMVNIYTVNKTKDKLEIADCVSKIQTASTISAMQLDAVEKDKQIDNIINGKDYNVTIEKGNSTINYTSEKSKGILGKIGIKDTKMTKKATSLD